MKNNICINADAFSSISLKLIYLVAKKRYDEALEVANDILLEDVNDMKKELAVLIYLQILVLKGHDEVAKSLIEKFQYCIKTNEVQSLCMRTLAQLN